LEVVACGGDQVVDVAAVGEGDVVADPADVGAERALPLGAETGLDLVLDGVLELEAAPGEELDAVVRHGVVRGGDDDSEVDVVAGGQVGDTRGGQHADLGDVDSGAGQTCRD